MIKKIKTALTAAFSKNTQSVANIPQRVDKQPNTDLPKEAVPGIATDDAEVITAHATPSREAEWAWC